MFLKIPLLSMLLTFSLMANDLQLLKNEYINIIGKYNNGSIYSNHPSVDQERISLIKNDSPFSRGIPIDLTTVDLQTMRQEYLRTMKMLIRGLLYTEESFDYDRPNNPAIMKDFRYSMVSGEGFNTLLHVMNEVEKNNIEGDFVETGIWRGGISMFMKAFIKAHGNKRTVWAADSFEGFPVIENDRDTEICNNHYLPEIVVSLETVQNNFKRHGLLDDKVIFLKGWFKDTLPKVAINKIAVLRLDGDLYDSTKDAIEVLYPKLTIGGYLIVDDYLTYPGCDRAIAEYRQAHNIEDEMIRQGPTCNGIYWKKTHD